MIKIAFRGKRIDNNEWAYGSPCMMAAENKAFIINKLKSRDLSQNDTTFTGLSIDPKTLSQFTGIKDRNGKDIYEGDIVKNGMSGNWIIQPLEEGAMSLLGISAQYKGSNYDISALNENVEVIGNIHEKILAND